MTYKATSSIQFLTTLSSSPCTLSPLGPWCFKTCQAANLNIHMGDFVLIVLSLELSS